MTTSTLDREMREIFAKRSNGLKKADSAKHATEATVTYSVRDGGLQADTQWKIKVRAGKRFEILSEISVQYDSRGWSADNWETRSGPNGVAGWYSAGTLGYPNCPVGMLIGAIHRDEIPEGGMKPEDAQHIFTNNVLAVGSNYIGVSPIDGWLYLTMNDSWSWGDNKGAVHVIVKVEQ